jgi:hypothetical protein
MLRYDEYMDYVRGLAPKALRIVGRLLASRFATVSSTSPI